MDFKDDRSHRGSGHEMRMPPPVGMNGMPPPPPRHCEPTPMMLLRDVQKLFDHFIRAEHEQVNMQSSCRHLLFHLSIQDGCTQLQLAKLTHLKPPTVSVTLQKMEHDGYVTRRSDENDLRQTLVFLTDKGREYNLKIRNRVQQLEKIVMSDISPEEKEVLMKLLSRMRDNLTKELENTIKASEEQSE